VQWSPEVPPPPRWWCYADGSLPLAHCKPFKVLWVLTYSCTALVPIWNHLMMNNASLTNVDRAQTRAYRHANKNRAVNPSFLHTRFSCCWHCALQRSLLISTEAGCHQGHKTHKMAFLAHKSSRVAAPCGSSKRTHAPAASIVCGRPQLSRNGRKALHVVAEANKRGPQPAAAQVHAD
jgi:hypothetical protein